MDLDYIIAELNKRFAEQLPEFYKRRIIFWYDEDKQFLDKIEEVSLSNAKVYSFTEGKMFELKKLLSVDDPNSNYLIYAPLSFENEGDNWLLDIQQYSEEFRADLISIWMDELCLDSNPTMREMSKMYRSFLNAQLRRKKFANLKSVPKTAPQFHMSVMACICGLKVANATDIICAVMEAGVNENSNSIYQDMKSYDVLPAFWEMIRQGTGYGEEEPSLNRMVTHILLTAATRTMREELLAGLDSFISTPHQSYCYDLISGWIASGDRNNVISIISGIESEIKLYQRFMKLSISDLMDTDCFTYINEIILIKLMTEISDHIIDINVIKDTVEKRRTSNWYKDNQVYFEGVLQVANMQAFFIEHSSGFHEAEAKKAWRLYTDEYYKMDQYYRGFHKCYAESLKAYNPELGDLFNHVCDKVEGLYSTWYLDQLGGNWTNVCEGDLSKYGKILEIPEQKNFYSSKIKNANSRVFVIISDALRYEVAAELSGNLSREMQGQVALSSVQAVFPTITKMGMAALLPNKELTVEQKASGTEKLTVFVDGQTTNGKVNRDKILKNANPNSVALKYKDIVAMKRDERSALVKGMNVVYIYHDKIDETAHNSELEVFGACDDAINEIINLCKIIVNDFSGTQIYITADHGFLYNYSPLREDDKVEKSDFINRVVEYGRRYAIMMKDSNPDYLVKVDFPAGKGELEAYAPRESTRIKTSAGSGMNFVHGGISLQEMVVPVIDFHRLRNDSSEYKKNKEKYDTKPVEVDLLSAGHKVTNMAFFLNFYQKDAVSTNREATTYNVYFADGNGKQISDVQKIIADKASADAQERTFRVKFNLKSQKYDNKEIYYLVIEQEGGLDLPKKIEFNIDIAFAADDFGFF